jgi:hypothetical protein
LRKHGCNVKSSGTESNAAIAAMELSMRAETQGLIEEIKQSLRLLRRHL